MLTKVLKKSVILFAIYSILIIGIFVLQFKNDSIISEKIGSLHITLLENASDNEKVTLKNKFSASFNGILFSANEEKPVKINTGKSEKSVALVSWVKESPLSCVFVFTNDVKIRFSLSDETSSAILNVKAMLPSNVSDVLIPYGLTSGATMTTAGDSNIQIQNRKNTWELNAADIFENYVVLNKKTSVASYNFMDKTKSFTFAVTSTVENSSEQVYQETIESLKNNLISGFATVTPETSISEQEAVSYVAVMASKGKYPEAIENVPQNFKKSATRTYLSAPYFNSLVKMNETMQRQMTTFSDMISVASENASFDVFAVKNIADYMCMHPGSTSVKKLLEKTVTLDVSDISVQHAAAVITVYVDLWHKNRELSNIMESGLSKYIEKIESACNLDDSKITLVEKGTFLSVTNASYVGQAILAYGTILNNTDYMNTGRLIIYSYLKDSASFDLRTLSELYPIVVQNNTYYPHFEILGFGNKGAVWAWTCANSMSYANDNAGTVTLNINFPLSFTHYLIINGIEEFKSIYIYDIAFRSDYRFETYNSSGYVYQAEPGILLLKSRHRSECETVRLESKLPEEKEAEIKAASSTESSSAESSETAESAESAE